MKTNYYELQVYVEGQDYRTIFAYSGTRSNANRKFRAFLRKGYISTFLSYNFRVRTYSSVHSFLAGEVICTTPFFL